MAYIHKPTTKKNIQKNKHITPTRSRPEKGRLFFLPTAQKERL